jgi:hypothetical protein
VERSIRARLGAFSRQAYVNVVSNFRVARRDAASSRASPFDVCASQKIPTWRHSGGLSEHPVAAGQIEQFRKLVEDRDRLLAALGTSAPPPKPPAYAPSGAHIIYRRVAGLLGRKRGIFVLVANAIAKDNGAINILIRDQSSNRSDRISMTSVELSFRFTPIAKHSRVNPSMMFSMRYFRPS